MSKKELRLDAMFKIEQRRYVFFCVEFIINIKIIKAYSKFKVATYSDTEIYKPYCSWGISFRFEIA